MNRTSLLTVVLLLASMTAMGQHVPMHKLSSSLRQHTFRNIASRQSRYLRQPAAEARAVVCAFVKVDGDTTGLFSQHGVQVVASEGDIHVCSMPLDCVETMAADSRVVRIEASRGMRANNHDMPLHLNINKVYEGTALPSAYTGKGVVMGVMDIGFDLTNPNFYTADMSRYRIQAMWDMLSVDTIGSRFLVGNDYVGEDALLAYAHSRDGLEQNHGSHTLGTAAGSGVGTKYRGVAYDSDICLVSNAVNDDEKFIDEKDLSKYTYAADYLGFKYIFDYADSQGKPCVISFSEGSTQDLKGDDILYYEMLEKLVGKGHILVASAGNASSNPNFVTKPAGVESAGSFVEAWGGEMGFMSTGRGDYCTRVVLYSTANDTVSIVTTPCTTPPHSGRVIEIAEHDFVYRDTLDVNGTTYVVSCVAYADCYDEDRTVVEVRISGPDHIGGSKVPVSFETVGLEADVDTYKLNGYFNSNDRNPELHDAIVSRNIGCPGSAPSVICVGATAYSTGYVNMFGEQKTYDLGQNGERATFSSIGPTCDGRTKPEVMAPGANIVSSTSSFYFEENPNSPQIGDLVDSYEHQGRTYYWKADTGTSMSTPAVGGAIALWLEAKPDLTPDEVLDVFAHTCSHPDPTLEYPNNCYGYGQIDVYRGLLYLLGIDQVEGISTHQPRQVSFKPIDATTFVVEFAKPTTVESVVRVYSTSGCLLHTQPVAKGIRQANITLPATSTAVVVVQVDSPEHDNNGSTLLRLVNKH